MGGVGAPVYVAVLAYFAIVVALFTTQAPRRAVLVSLLGGLLFLPVFDGRLQLAIIHTKVVLTEFVVLSASLLFHLGHWRRVRISAWDLAAGAVCAIPFVASLENERGAYEGLAAVFEASFTWGGAYALGRVYFCDVGALRDLARAVVAAGVVYVPFCWWELRMSPQLHRLLYGYHQHSFLQHMRDAGFRPMVFMQHGLMVATFMSTATLLAYWMWRSRDRRPIFGIPLGWTVALLGFTAVMCKSLAALIFLLVGVGVLEASRRLRSPTLVVLLLAIAPAYCAVRISGWAATPIVDLAYGLVSPSRAESLEFRIVNEDRLVARAMERPWLGWGRGKASRVRDEDGRDIAVTDSLWILVLGAYGVVGLLALGSTLLLPEVALLRAFPRRLWSDPRLAPATALAVALALWVLDDTLNAMVSPVFPLMAGALVALAVSGPSALRSPRLVPGSGALALTLRRG
ncbi:MAG TPA: hypothetical protein VLT47_12215 [Anaeromyxobacteraceae bacterium]|nr:hypothetical protein [Anaeromyxobacteraceae bacterium]